MKALTVLLMICLLAPLTWAGPSVTVGVGANRLPRFCTSQGGQAFSALSPQRNSKNLCSFPGGAVIDSWTLFKNKSSRTLAVDALLNSHGQTATALEHCHIYGGKVIEYTADSTQISLCAFPDMSAIEVMTLFKGPYDSKNKNLVNVLLTPKEN